MLRGKLPIKASTSKSSEDTILDSKVPSLHSEKPPKVVKQNSKRPLPSVDPSAEELLTLPTGNKKSSFDNICGRSFINLATVLIVNNSCFDFCRIKRKTNDDDNVIQSTESSRKRTRGGSSSISDVLANAAFQPATSIGRRMLHTMNLTSNRPQNEFLDRLEREISGYGSGRNNWLSENDVNALSRDFQVELRNRSPSSFIESFREKYLGDLNI